MAKHNDNQQPKNIFADIDNSKDAQPLVGHHGSWVWQYNKCGNKTEYRELKDPESRIHPLGRYIQLSLNEPKTNTFSQKKNNGREYNLYCDRSREYIAQPLLVTLAQLKRHEPNDGTGHRARDHAEHSHHAAHHIEDAEVRDAQHLQHHPTGVERHHQREEQSDIEHQSVLGNAFRIYLTLTPFSILSH